MPVQASLYNYTSPENNYVLVRSEILYYLKVINYDKDLFKDASSLTSKPTITFYTENASNKVIIDYSLANEVDKKYLNSFFANMTQIDTFSITSGGYLDEAELSANLNGSYTFTEYKDGKIFAVVNSVSSQNSAVDVYTGNYFTGTPQITKTGNLGSSPTTENYALVNINPNTDKSLTSLGLVVGDFIEIVKSGSANNQIKYEIQEISVIKNKEVVRVKPYNSQIPVVESLVGSPVTINVYVKGVSSYVSEEISSELGCCYNAVGTIKLPNQTRHQCRIRSEDYDFSVGECSDTINSSLVNNTQQISPTDSSENKLFYVYISGFTPNTNVTNSFIRTTQSSNKSILVANSNGIVYSNNELVLRRGVSYNFVQQDISNQNVILRLAVDTSGTPFNGIADILSIITQDSLNSNISVNVRDTSVSTLYLVSVSDNSTLPVKISLID
jgi:hypothetical protein